MTRFLVTGASGLLGLNFALKVYRDHEVTGVVNHHPLNNPPFPVVAADLASQGEAARLVKELHPEVVLNCAALANVDACESTPELALRVNAGLPGELAEACREQGARLVHISTDAVFNGQTGDYREDDPPCPVNHYGHTKLIGEQEVAGRWPQALIARVNFYGWSMGGRRSLAEIFYYNLASGKKMPGFTDVYFCPFYVGQLSEVLLQMIAQDLSGLYHVVSPESISKYQFGVMIAEKFELDSSLIMPSSWKDAGLKAARSPHLTLNTQKLRNALSISLPDQASGIQAFFEQRQAGLPQRLRAMDANLPGPTAGASTL